VPLMFGKRGGSGGLRINESPFDTTIALLIPQKGLQIVLTMLCRHDTQIFQVDIGRKCEFSFC
jgi:hypothetical protein